MSTITEPMISTATQALLDRGYTLRHLPDNPDAVWLQAPGPMPGAGYWPICQMSRAKAWNLIWSLYEQEVQS